MAVYPFPGSGPQGKKCKGNFCRAHHKSQIENQKSYIQTVAFSARIISFSRPMIRLVLFDIDGTLVHTGGAGVKAFAKVFQTEFDAHDHFEKLKFAGRTDTSLV